MCLAVYVARGVSAWGVSAQHGVCLGGVHPLDPEADTPL